MARLLFLTTGFNPIRTLAARLQYFEAASGERRAVSGGQTRYLLPVLKPRAKSTTPSHPAPVYYVDLCLRDGMVLDAAVSQA